MRKKSGEIYDVCMEEKRRRRRKKNI